jgi:hypothetical protein
MDMDGSIAHWWPGVEGTDRVKLLPNGELALIRREGGLGVFDWNGKLLWSWKTPQEGDIHHHDFAPLRNGNFLVLLRNVRDATDYLVEVDRSGRETWRWEPQPFLRDDLTRYAARHPESRDSMHVNSVQELPPNRWYDAGEEAFRPGNILISARNLNALYIISRATGEIVWRYHEGLDHQHEALMTPPGMPGEGLILFFNNGLFNLASYRESSIVELQPVERRVTWQYRSAGFFSSIESAQQLLPSGNLLVTSSRGQRVFEITRDGRTVWQWTPPFYTLRVRRYFTDYCAQLAKLGPASNRPVQRRDPAQYIDADLYRFALVQDRREVGPRGGRISVLKEPSGCRTLQLPVDPELKVGYGRECRRSRKQRARFEVTIRDLEGREPKALLDRLVEPGEFPVRSGRAALRRETIPLKEYSRRKVELCLALNGVGTESPPPCFVWESPTIRPGARRPLDRPSEPVDPEVEDLQRRQLEAMGYI